MKFYCSPLELEDNSKIFGAIYSTSGSTDTPKNVGVSHAQILENYIAHW